MRRVTAICNGTVIDHIPGGQSLQVLRMLKLDSGRSNPISLVMNVPSDKLGRKDVLKIEDRELVQEELDRLAIIAPEASVAIIRNYRLHEVHILSDLSDEYEYFQQQSCKTKYFLLQSHWCQQYCYRPMEHLHQLNLQHMLQY